RSQKKDGYKKHKKHKNKQAAPCGAAYGQKHSRTDLLFRRRGRVRLDLGDALIEGIHLGDETFFHLLAVAAVDDAQVGSVTHDVRRKRQEAGDETLVLKAGEVERGDLVRELHRIL